MLCHSVCTIMVCYIIVYCYSGYYIIMYVYNIVLCLIAVYVCNTYTAIKVHSAMYNRKLTIVYKYSLKL